MRRFQNWLWIGSSLTLIGGCGFSFNAAVADGIAGGVSDTIATLLSTLSLGFLGVSA